MLDQILLFQIPGQEIQHNLEVGIRPELSPSVPGTIDESQGDIVGTDGRLESVVKQLALLGGHIAVGRAVLDEEGRSFIADIGDRVDGLGLFRNGLNGSAYQLRFG